MELYLKCTCGNDDRVKLKKTNFQDDINKSAKFKIFCSDGYVHMVCCSCNRKIEIYND